VAGGGWHTSHFQFVFPVHSVFMAEGESLSYEAI